MIRLRSLSILSVLFIASIITIQGYTIDQNQIVDDSIEEFSFGLIQFSSATHITQSYGTVTASSVTASLLDPDTTEFEITTQGTIPLTPDAYISSIEAFGYAWLDSTSFPTNAVAATIHPGMTDTSPDPNVWHTHNVVLNAGGCVTSFEDILSLFGTNGNYMPMTVFESTNVTPSTFQSATSFEFVTDTTTCPTPLNGLRMVK